MYELLANDTVFKFCLVFTGIGYGLMAWCSYSLNMKILTVLFSSVTLAAFYCGLCLV